MQWILCILTTGWGWRWERWHWCHFRWQHLEPSFTSKTRVQRARRSSGVVETENIFIKWKKTPSAPIQLFSGLCLCSVCSSSCSVMVKTSTSAIEGFHSGHTYSPTCCSILFTDIRTVFSCRTLIASQAPAQAMSVGHLCFQISTWQIRIHSQNDMICLIWGSRMLLWFFKPFIAAMLVYFWKAEVPEVKSIILRDLGKVAEKDR